MDQTDTPFIITQYHTQQGRAGIITFVLGWGCARERGREGESSCQHFNKVRFVQIKAFSGSEGDCPESLNGVH